MTSVLVVDDEESISRMIATALAAEGAVCITAADGRQALLASAREPFDVIVLDWMLPDIDGLAVLESLRRDGCTTPVLMLTARDAVEEKVKALRLADDYLTKPFHVAELVARVFALARRNQGAVSKDILTVANLEVDESLHEVRVSGEALAFTPNEYRLTRVLTKNANRVVSRDDAIDAVWGPDYVGGRANLDTCASSVRRKLAAAGGPSVDTVRGFGYLIRGV